MSDPLVTAFENGTVDPKAFHHREHLYVAWCYLRELPLEEALARYVRNLRALTRTLGVPEKYHATMTWAYLALLDGLMQEPELRESFEALANKHPSLFDAKDGMLFDHYDQSELQSEAARRRFVLPSRPR
ncbi:MAG: hypothetical protein ACXWUG_13885 [Polyangiales bacterium]